MIVIRTIKLKLDVDSGGCASLLTTMREYTVAFETAAAWGFENHSANKVNCHFATYRDVRSTVPDLPSSLVQGARDCACEALKATKCRVLPVRHERAAMRYNQRVIRANLDAGYATVATSRGRVRAEFFVPAYYRKYIGWTVKSSTVSYRRRDRRFYLHCQIEARTPELVFDGTVLGIDRGIVNVAVCSDNSFFNDGCVKNARGKYARLRSQLQSTGTRSAKRKLKRLAGRERRFVTDTNHIISKQIVASPFTVFALEDLTKIRVKQRRSTDFNRKLNSWSFYELEQFLRYKAEAVGKQIVLVDARYTSQKCSVCGHTYKGNRDRSDFRCRKCGFQLHADLNAARNIAHGGISALGGLCVNQPIVACL